MTIELNQVLLHNKNTIVFDNRILNNLRRCFYLYQQTFSKCKPFHQPLKCTNRGKTTSCWDHGSAALQKSLSVLYLETLKRHMFFPTWFTWKIMRSHFLVPGAITFTTLIYLSSYSPITVFAKNKKCYLNYSHKSHFILIYLVII